MRAVVGTTAYYLAQAWVGLVAFVDRVLACLPWRWAP